MVLCPLCGKELKLEPYPDTGTDTDFYEATCPDPKHRYELQVDNQTGYITLTELGEEEDTEEEDMAEP